MQIDGQGIDGKQNFKISGGMKVRCFIIANTESKVTLVGLNITSGFSADDARDQVTVDICGLTMAFCALSIFYFCVFVCLFVCVCL
jgi:hypothetical protein